jgi:Ca2+-binding EF-hand superfamily protein
MQIQKRFTVAIATAAVVLSFTHVASAQPVRGGQTLTDADTPMSSSHKAKLSFEAVDTNHDGEITPEEMTAAAKKYPRLAKMGAINAYIAADTNHDGALTKSEFMTWLRAQK